MPLRSATLQDSRALRAATVFYLYAMQGIPAGFAFTAIANRLAAEGVSPPAIGRFVALVGLPWTLQFVWGPVIDRFQGSPMGRRRPWLLGAQCAALLASLGLLAVRDPAAQLAALSAAFFVHSVFASVQDTSADAMAISVIPAAERTRITAFMRGGMLAGQAAGAAGLASVMREGGFRAAVLAQSLVLLVLTAATFWIRERPGDARFPWSRARPARDGAPDPAAPAPADPRHDLTIREIFTEFARGALSPGNLAMFVALLSVYLAASVFIRAFSVHLVQRLRWDDTALSVLTGTYGMFTAVFAIAATGALAGRVPPRRLLTGVMLVLAAYLVAFNLVAPAWDEPAVVRAGLVVWYTFDPAFSVVAMPVLMGLCRKGVEGSQFTAYMAMVNLADVAGSLASGYALTVVPVPAIGVACGAVVLAALVVVRRSPRWGAGGQLAA